MNDKKEVKLDREKIDMVIRCARKAFKDRKTFIETTGYTPEEVLLKIISDGNRKSTN